MSDQSNHEAVAEPEKARQAAPQQTAGRPPGDDAQAFQRACELIETDGVSDAEAALLAGQDPEWLGAWLEAHPRARRELMAARAEFRRQRLATICTAQKKDDVDWRAQAYLLENTPEVTAPTRPEGEQAQGSRSLPAGAARNWQHDFIITPDHLRELQQHRQAALARLNPKPEGAQP